MQSPCVQSSVTPNHRGSRTDTHNSDKSDRICIQRQQKKKKKEEGINKKWTILRRKGRWRVSRERVVNYFKKVLHVTRRVRGWDGCGGSAHWPLTFAPLRRSVPATFYGDYRCY